MGSQTVSQGRTGVVSTDPFWSLEKSPVVTQAAAVPLVIMSEEEAYGTQISADDAWNMIPGKVITNGEDRSNSAPI